MKPVRVLLTEGSSLSARETITALGLAGHLVDVCDPDLLCLARFSRFVGRVHRCPPSGRDPEGYLSRVREILSSHAYDVLLPVHEQAYLLAHARDVIPRGVGVALASAAAFDRVQTKTSFTRLLSDLGLPQPATVVVRDREDLRSPRPYPFFVKTAWGTAASGVIRVADRASHEEACRRIEAQGGLAQGVVVQAPALGALERVQAVFDRGVCVAIHAYRQIEEGVRGGDVRKQSVRRPLVREHVEQLGRALHWHGALALDLFWDEARGAPSYIDANPRLVEPMSATLSGVNLAVALLGVSLGECPAFQEGREGVRTHLAVPALLRRAEEGASRRELLREAAACALARGRFAGGVEELTPARTDPLSATAFAYVLGRLLVDPRAWAPLSGGAVSAYALTPAGPTPIRGG